MALLGKLSATLHGLSGECSANAVCTLTTHTITASSVRDKRRDLCRTRTVIKFRGNLVEDYKTLTAVTQDFLSRSPMPLGITRNLEQDEGRMTSNACFLIVS